MMVDKLKLLMGRPIILNKESNIFVHQPLFSEIVDIGENGFNDIVLPYILTTEFVFNGVENEEELISQYHLFDLFFIKVNEDKTLLDNIFGGRKSIDVLTESLKYFLKADSIRVLEKMQKIVVDDNYLIDKNEFDKIRQVIKTVTGRKDLEAEKPPKNMTKRQKDIWIKLQKGRKRKAEKDAIYLQDIVNFVSFGGNSYIPTDQIDKMTYYQLQNAYKSVMGKDAFSIGMSYKLAYKFDVKDEVKHWTESMKIGK